MIADIQGQIWNIIKLADIANNQLVDIETILLQAGEMHKMQVGGDIYTISYTEIWKDEPIISRSY